MLAAEVGLVTRSGLLGFATDPHREAVERRYLSVADEDCRAAHDLLARTFATYPLGPRVVEELPWQQLAAGDIDSMVATISDLAFTELAYRTADRDLIRLWARAEIISGRGADAAVIRVALPQHLRTLAGVPGEVSLEVAEPATLRSVLDALEASYPQLRGTIRDHGTAERRSFIRFFVCGRDISLESADDPLPGEIASGAEVVRVVGAMAGG